MILPIREKPSHYPPDREETNIHIFGVKSDEDKLAKSLFTLQSLIR